MDRAEIRDTDQVRAGRSPIGPILLVDDSRLQRRIVSKYLEKWGFDVIEAESGDQALEICKQQQIDMVISDWMMPGMSGLEFCQAFRALNREGYGYFILLTSKSEKGEVAEGLEVGADDFLTKPVHAEELRARIAAGERIIRMERELIEKNRLVSTTLAEIKALYDSLDNDLLEAKKLQQSLVPKRFCDLGKAQMSLLLQPSGHVGGDLVGFFPIDGKSIGLFSIDVSGHGISSALMTARLAGYLSGANPDQNIALFRDVYGELVAKPPALVARMLNDVVFNEIETEHYFTLALAIFDCETGALKMVQAGHPHPAIQRADGGVEFVGSGGLPIGLIPDVDYQDFAVQLNPGDRVLIASDGITECVDENDHQLDEEGLEDIMRRSRNVRGPALLETLMWDLTAFAGERDFGDDISAILLERKV